MASINMNGKIYSGRSVSISNNKVIVNGVDITPDSKIINIIIEGDVDKIEVDYCESVAVNGNAQTIRTTSGDIICKDVKGDVQSTSGDIEAGNVGGSIQTVSGDINCNDVNGNVKTLSGDVKYKKK